MSVARATLSAGLAGLVYFGLGCGARSDVFCVGGDCTGGDLGLGGGSGSIGGGSGGGFGGGDVLGPAPGQTIDPPNSVPPPRMEMQPDPDLPVSGGREDAFCRNGAVASGPILIENARDLERLRGCEEIDGDLTLKGFIAPDLTALSSLRQVKGELFIQISGELAGLEALEQVWRLTLEGLQTPTLSPLQNLWRIGKYTGDESGRLDITDSFGFADLVGLSRVRDVAHVQIEGNPDLVTMVGLDFPQSLDELVVRSNVSLTDLGRVSNLQIANRIILDTNPELRTLAALSTLQEATTLTLEAIGVDSLEDLLALGSVTDLSIRDNAELLDVGRLSSVQFQSLDIVRNARLQSLPAFEVQELQQVQIRDNSALTTGPSFPHVLSASRLIFSRNPGLTRIDGFPSLTNVGTLEVRENASLLALELGSLAEYELARIVCNPALSESAITPDLSNLRELSEADERLELRGNLDSTQPCN